MDNVQKHNICNNRNYFHLAEIEMTVVKYGASRGCLIRLCCALNLVRSGVQCLYVLTISAEPSIQCELHFNLSDR
jgi:hypothetical protein